jgi:hypothetical protein
MEKAELPWMVPWLFYFKESGMMKINITIFFIARFIGLPSAKKRHICRFG